MIPPKKVPIDQTFRGFAKMGRYEEGMPYCSIQNRFTSVFKCPETHVCKTTGQCARCHWDEKKYHKVVSREEIPHLEEKGFVFDASLEALYDEWSPEKQERRDRGVQKLATEYVQELLNTYPENKEEYAKATLERKRELIEEMETMEEENYSSL